MKLRISTAARIILLAAGLGHERRNRQDAPIEAQHAELHRLVEDAAEIAFEAALLRTCETDSQCEEIGEYVELRREQRVKYGLSGARLGVREVCENY